MYYREAINYLLQNDGLLWWLAVTSFITFTTTLLIIPYIIVRIPEDYFLHEKRHHQPFEKYPTVIYLTITFLKNIVGVFLFILGLILIILPGQGLLTMLIGLLLTDFPGKYQTECWLIKKPSVLNSVNWLRQKSNKPPILTH